MQIAVMMKEDRLEAQNENLKSIFQILEVDNVRN